MRGRFKYSLICTVIYIGAELSHWHTNSDSGHSLWTFCCFHRGMLRAPAPPKIGRKRKLVVEDLKVSQRATNFMDLLCTEFCDRLYNRRDSRCPCSAAVVQGWALLAKAMPHVDCIHCLLMCCLGHSCPPLPSIKGFQGGLT